MMNDHVIMNTVDILLLLNFRYKEDNKSYKTNSYKYSYQVLIYVIIIINYHVHSVTSLALDDIHRRQSLYCVLRYNEY